jgi:hypothetical protein
MCRALLPRCADCIHLLVTWRIGYCDGEGEEKGKGEGEMEVEVRRERGRARQSRHCLLSRDCWRCQ